MPDTFAAKSGRGVLERRGGFARKGIICPPARVRSYRHLFFLTFLTGLCTMIALRPLTEADVPVIRSWPPYPPEFAGLDYSLRDGGWLDMYRHDPHNRVFVAADASGIAGFSLLLGDHDGPPELMVALHPDRIGGGLGKTVVRLTLAEGFSRTGTGRIRLIVRKNNFRAQALYESLHFARTGELTRDVQGLPVEFFTMEIARDDHFTKEE